MFTLYYTSGSPTFFTCVPLGSPFPLIVPSILGKMFVIIIVVVISNLDVVTVLHCWHTCLFPPFFTRFRVPLNVLVCTPKGMRTPVWESLYYTYLKWGWRSTNQLEVSHIEFQQKYTVGLWTEYMSLFMVSRKVGCIKKSTLIWQLHPPPPKKF